MTKKKTHIKKFGVEQWIEGFLIKSWTFNTEKERDSFTRKMNRTTKDLLPRAKYSKFISWIPLWMAKGGK